MQSAAGSAPFLGPGRVSVGMMPGLRLRKLVCKMLKAVARVTAAPTPAAFLSVHHALSQAFLSGRSHAVTLHLYGRGD